MLKGKKKKMQSEETINIKNRLTYDTDFGINKHGI